MAADLPGKSKCAHVKNNGYSDNLPGMSAADTGAPRVSLITAMV